MQVQTNRPQRLVTLSIRCCVHTANAISARSRPVSCHPSLTRPSRMLKPRADYIYTCTCIHVHTYIHTCVHVYVYMYAHTCTHIYTYIYMRRAEEGFRQLQTTASRMLECGHNRQCPWRHRPGPPRRRLPQKISVLRSRYRYIIYIYICNIYTGQCHKQDRPGPPRRLLQRDLTVLRSRYVYIYTANLVFLCPLVQVCD
jgi:hypothetical protein